MGAISSGAPSELVEHSLGGKARGLQLVCAIETEQVLAVIGGLYTGSMVQTSSFPLGIT